MDNTSDSTDELKLWLLVDPLTLEQAALLAVGIAPAEQVERPTAFMPIFAAAKQAVERRELPAVIPRVSIDEPWKVGPMELAAVKQSDMRDWLARMKINSAYFFLKPVDRWPQTIADAADSKPHGTDTDKSLDERERASMLRVIRALAVMNKLPERGGASSVEKQLQELGFNKPGEATIHKLLKDARGMEPDSKPQ